MADRYELTTSTWTPQERIRQRLDEDKVRLELAMTRVREAARELTPAATIRRDPIPWVLGAFTTGFVFGWLTAPPRR